MSSQRGGVEALFIPGQLLSQEAENLMTHVRNCGARLNRLKLARAAPDAPIWWQFLSSSDGSSEALDRSAFDLQGVLRDLEEATSELKRLCVAPASDVAGNVQREMEKKKWAVSTLDRWQKVIQGATRDCVEANAEAKKAEAEALAKHKQRQQRIFNNNQTTSSSTNSNIYNDDSEESTIGKTSGSLAAKAGNIFQMSAGEFQQQKQQQLEKEKEKEERQYTISELNQKMTQQRQQLIRDALDSQDHITVLHEDLQNVESSCSASLKLGQRFRDLEHIEQRFTNLNTRRRQFQHQVEAHLSGIGSEIEKEATLRRIRARQYYETHEGSYRPEIVDSSNKNSQKQHQHQHHVDPNQSSSSKNNTSAAMTAASLLLGGGDDNNNQKSVEQTPIYTVGVQHCSCCQEIRDEAQSLEKLRRKNWVDRAVRVLCTQAVDPETAKNFTDTSQSIIPSHRLLAVVGSKVKDGTPVVVKPLLSRKITKPFIGSAASDKSGISFDIMPAATPQHQQQSNDEEQEQQYQETLWRIPSAYDHSRYWNVRLNL